MKDRKVMANDGIIVMIANIDITNHKLLSDCNIITRGFVLVNDNQDVIKKIEEISNNAINQILKTNGGSLK